jgi:hypothetical protein
MTALFKNTIGYGNVGLGQNALYANTTGTYNMAIGSQTLSSNTTGGSNTGIGAGALYYNTTGLSNVAIGAYALYYTSTSNNNVAIGTFAGSYIADGSTSNTSVNSLFLGNNTKASALGVTNEIVIGYTAIGNGTNTATLGNSSIVSTFLRGNTAIGSTSFDSTNPERLLVYSATTTSVNQIVGRSSINSYLQLNIQNTSTGASSSSDVIATNNTGNETTNYIDMGINGSAYSNASWTISGANDSYLYSMSGDLTVGTATASKVVKIHTGGTLAANVRATIDDIGILVNGEYRLAVLNTAPSSSTDTGTLGEIRITSTYIYVCTATNTWVRSALTSW